MMSINVTALDRKSGGAQWRDLRFSGSSLDMFFERGVMGFRPTQGDEKRLLFSNYSLWKRLSPLCHLDRSAAQWRDLRFHGPFLGMFFDRGVMGFRPTQGDEKRLLFGNYCPSKHCPPLCHLDRSAAKWRDLRFSGPFLGMFFDGSGATTRVTGLPDRPVQPRRVAISGGEAAGCTAYINAITIPRSTINK
jgi:hypothetical protein